MPNKPLSPDSVTLRSYLLGTLPHHEAETVQEWVEANPIAVETLNHIDATDHVTRAIADSSPVISCPESIVDAAVRTLAQHGLPSWLTEVESALPTRIGKYQIVGVVGRGGMGVVLEAVDESLGRRVAIKLIAPRFAADPAIRARFEREAQIVADLDHANVVPIYEFGEQDGFLYIVMPLLKGETLESRLLRDGRLSATEVRRIGREVAAGLEAAHAKAVIHRDIKPSNIWLDADTGRVRLLDFGLAKPVEEAKAEQALTRTGAIMGTILYLSPEQAQSKLLDTRSDFFSLGAVLYEAATGHRPFEGETAVAVILAVVNETPPAADVENASVPRSLSSAIRRLMEKIPANRPATAAEVIALLQEPPQRSTFPRWALAASLLIVIGVAFNGTIYRVVTNQGELVVEIDDPNVEVKLVRNGLVIQDITGKREFTLKAGQGEIEVVEKDGIKLLTKQFELTRNGKTTVKVTLRDVTDARQAKNPIPDRKAAEWVLSLRGLVRVNGVDRDIWRAADLPNTPYRLTGVNLNTKPGVVSLEMLKTLRTLTYLNLGATQVTDIELAHVKDCEKTTFLSLGTTIIGDSGVANFQRWKDLTYLDVGATLVSNAGLQYFEQNKSLGILSLNGANVTDPGLNLVKTFKRLAYLDVKNTKVTKEKLIELAKQLPACRIEWNGGVIGPTDPDAHATLFVLACGGSVKVNGAQTEIVRAADLPIGPLQLWWVNLSDQTEVANWDLSLFKSCKTLASIDLSNTQVRDAWVVQLQGNTTLTVLDLRNTKITDAGLVQLKNCTRLTQLDLRQATVTPKGVFDLAKALPDCKIVWDQGIIEPTKK